VEDGVRAVWPRPMSSYGDSYAYKDIIVARSDFLIVKLKFVYYVVVDFATVRLF